MLDDNRGFFLTPTEGRFFDLRNLQTIAGKNPMAGGLHVTSCPMLALHVVTTSDGAVSFYRYRRDRQSLSCVENYQADGIAKPYIMFEDNTLYSAFGSGNNNFSVHSSIRSGNRTDIWKQWKNLYGEHGHPSPVLDLTMLKEQNNIVVFSVSSEMIRGTAIPLFDG
jgi:hypothetical protein